MEKVKLSEEHRKRMVELGNKQEAIKTWMETMQDRGMQKIKEVQAEGKALFDEMDKNYGLNIGEVDYTFDGESLVPVQIRLRKK